MSALLLSDHLSSESAIFKEHYNIKSVLGHRRGSNVTMHRCVHRRTKEDCAVKLINVKHMDYSEEAVVHEIMVLKEMQESNSRGTAQFIALFHTYEPYQYQLVVSYWKSVEPLFDCITHKWYEVAHTWDSRPYEEEDACKIFRGLVRAVDNLHSRGIAHGNLAPDTILLDAEHLGNPKLEAKIYLADLESARFCPAGSKVEMPTGTPGYAAPEQIWPEELLALRRQRGQGSPASYDMQADVWSLGILLYQILCGYPPFVGTGSPNDRERTIEAVHKGSYKFAESEWRFITDPPMDLIKRQMLRKDPQLRTTTSELLKHPWVSGQHFLDAAEAEENGRVVADGTHHKRLDGKGGELSSAVRQMRLFNAKRKFRAGIRTLMAQNALEGLLVGMEREKLLLAIGSEYNESKLRSLYKLFERKAEAEVKKLQGSKAVKKDVKAGVTPALLRLRQTSKTISKQAFGEVIQKVLPDIARTKKSAEAHFRDFKNSNLEDAVLESDFLLPVVGQSQKKAMEQASQKAEEQREACRDLIDYREYTVALSAICLRSDERRRLTFIFGLLDEDNSGTLDRDEFAQLLGGVLQSSGLSKAELARQLKADFDAVDVDGSGELDIREFIRAATELPRLQKYFAELSKMATTQQDQAQENEDRMAQKRAATLLQARIRGNRDRRKLQDPEFVKSLHLEERAFTRHIVYSHPVFDTQYELCMPISEKRMLALKKLFALADLQHQERLGASQFRELLQLLGVDVEPTAAMKMFRTMDADGGGAIEFEEFADGMLEGFQHDEIEAAANIDIGAMGTRMWSRGEIVWAANTAAMFVSSCACLAGLVYFDFILIPLWISYFLCFLMAPVMTVLEERPCKVKDQHFCRISTSPSRVAVHGTPRADLFDLMHSCKFPHGISVLTTLFLCLGILFIILYTAVTELQAVMSDDEFQQGWDMLIADIDDFLNESGVVILKDEADGYTMDEIKSVLTQVSGVFNMVGLVLLLTVYIMATYTVDQESKRDMGPTARKVDEMMKFYIDLKTALSLLTGVITASILLACRVKLAIMFGILAFVLNYIPNIGSVIAMCLPVPIIIVDVRLSSVEKLLGVLGPACVQGYIGNVLEPQIFGKSLNMTPISILVALVFWASLWGVLGAVMAVPLLGIQKIMLEKANHPVAKALLVLIREDPTIDEEAERMAKRVKALEQGHETNHHRHQVIHTRSKSQYDEINEDSETFEVESGEAVSVRVNKPREPRSASATERFIGDKLQARADMGKRGGGGRNSAQDMDDNV